MSTQSSDADAPAAPPAPPRPSPDRDAAGARSRMQRNMRDVIDRSESGAPAAGEALRDLFSTDEIFHRLVVAADEEFSRSTRLLFLSGLAAGLSISLSFLGMTALTALWPGETARLVGCLLYPLGFLFVVMGRYQLFTENTLTPVTLVLTRIASIPRLLRIWGVVLVANVLGAALCAYVLATTGVFSPEMAAVAHDFGMHFLEMSWSDLFWKGVFAGWLVAGMVWLNYAARDMTTRFLLTFTLIYTVAAAELAHCIVGSAEVLYVVFQGDATFGAFFTNFLTPAVLGNTVGGVLLVAILNFSQTRDQRFPGRDCGRLELTWTEWLFGQGTPHSSLDPGESAPTTPSVREDDHALGPADAPVTIVQYGDYECPTSREIYDAVQDALRQTGAFAENNGANGSAGPPVRYVFRHLPLQQRHPHAVNAGLAAEAAAEQDRFWAMHDRLFTHQDALDPDALHDHAAAVGLDIERFDQDLNDERLWDRVMEDRSDALQSGVNRTSNLFINGERYRGPFDPGAIRRAVRDRAQRPASSPA